MQVLVYSVTTHRDGKPSVWFPGLARNTQWERDQRAHRNFRIAQLAGDLLGATLWGLVTYGALLVLP